MITFRILAYGYLPIDDSLRHAAKAVSGKAWNEILVVRDDIQTDSHPGWHFLLANLARLAGTNGSEPLVCFSVVFLFFLFFLIPLMLMRRPEAWCLAVLIAACAQPVWIRRLLLGRPLIFSMAELLAIGILWPRLEKDKLDWGAAVFLTLLAALATWIHGSWYLQVLPVGALLAARKWRAGLIVTGCLLVGTGAGLFLTGYPWVFLRQTWLHMVRAVLEPSFQRAVVAEFRPWYPDFQTALAVVCVFLWRKRRRGSLAMSLTENPVLALAVLGWVLGMTVSRFWLDWGLPAATLWMALEFQDELQNRMSKASGKRFVLAGGVLAVLFVTFTANVEERWTSNLGDEHLSLENPEHAAWLPDPGGIVYSEVIKVFYQTFYSNPRAEWRYMLGFEPTWMPPEELKIFHNIKWNFGESKAFEPWVKKMKPADRLILIRRFDNAPRIPGLEW